MEESGKIYDKIHFPLMKLYVGDIDSNLGSTVTYELGPLKCQGGISCYNTVDFLAE